MNALHEEQEKIAVPHRENVHHLEDDQVVLHQESELLAVLLLLLLDLHRENELWVVLLLLSLDLHRENELRVVLLSLFALHPERVPLPDSILLDLQIENGK